MDEPWEAASARRRARREAARHRRRRRRLGALLLALAIAALAIIVVSALAQRGASRHKARAPYLATRQPPRAIPRRTSRTSRLARVMAVGDARIQRLARLGLPIYCAGQRGNEVAFTFDDGPGPYTYLALRKLKQAGERATFFVVGRSMDAFPGHLRAELPLGAIGDHTYHHLDLPLLSPTEIHSELFSAKLKIEAATGQRVYLFRPPYGARDTEVDQTARRLGLLEILWSMDSRDSLGANWAGIIGNVEAGLHPGAIILMHENRGQTIRALTTLLPVLHERHLRSVSLPQLFATDPPSVAQMRRGLLGCVGQGRPVVLSVG